MIEVPVLYEFARIHFKYQALVLMRNKYFKHLLSTEFVCLYMGNWKDEILLEAQSNDLIDVTTEGEAIEKLNNKCGKSVICVLSDFKGAKFSQQSNMRQLYEAAKLSGKRVIVFGYRGLGVLTEKNN